MSKIGLFEGEYHKIDKKCGPLFDLDISLMPHNFFVFVWHLHQKGFSVIPEITPIIYSFHTFSQREFNQVKWGSWKCIWRQNIICTALDWYRFEKIGPLLARAGRKSRPSGCFDTVSFSCSDCRALCSSSQTSPDNC